MHQRRRPTPGAAPAGSGACLRLAVVSAAVGSLGGAAIAWVRLRSARAEPRPRVQAGGFACLPTGACAAVAADSVPAGAYLSAALCELSCSSPAPTARAGGAPRAPPPWLAGLRRDAARGRLAEAEIERLEGEVGALRLAREEAEANYQAAASGTLHQWERQLRLQKAAAEQPRAAPGGGAAASPAPAPPRTPAPTPAPPPRTPAPQPPTPPPPPSPASVAEAAAAAVGAILLAWHDNELGELNAPWLARARRAPAWDIGGAADLHVWYVVDCTSSAPDYAVWQGAALEGSWARARQPGALTRLASGCSPTHPETGRFNVSVAASVSPRAGVFFAPGLELRAGDNDSYPPGNRPPAALYWLARGHVRESVLVAVDPDFVWLRPLPPLGAIVRPGAMAAHEYQYLTAPSGPRNWARLVAEACAHHGLDAAPGADGPAGCSGVSPAATVRYGVGVPYALHRGDWARLLPLWCAALPPVRRAYRKQEDDMVAFAWAAWRLQLNVTHTQHTLVWPPDKQWAGSVPLHHPDEIGDPALLHYCYPADAHANSSNEELAGEQFPRNFSSPADLVRWELQRGRPLVETAFFSKWKVPSAAIAACNGPLLFEHPPLPTLFRTAWYSEVGKRWLFHYTTIARAVNRGVAAFRRLWCGQPRADTRQRFDGDAGQRVVRPWWGGGYASWGEPPIWRSAYETVVDSSHPQGHYFRRAPWAWWKHSLDGGRSQGLRFLWKMPGSAHARSLHNHTGNLTLGDSVGFMSRGTTVDVVELRRGVMRVVSPVLGWVPSAGAVPLNSAAELERLM
eukprot:TRINITY_DN25896_c0_g1_i1.p1 TRINITY_DN25896_c0_g1~~TRINITY_DN25896_c0_g1_i1.p1  ORF type:complete len:854 (+),score=200.89 TRINITY_DN25896_c0_g1_i1:177-2564(+)